MSRSPPGLRRWPVPSSSGLPVVDLLAATTSLAAPFRAGWRNAPAGMRKDRHVSTDASAVVAEPPQPPQAAQPAEPPEPQAVVAPLTGAAIFLVVVVNADANSEDTTRSLCADMSALVRAVGFRDLNGHLTCVTGLGASAWDRLTGLPRPAGLHEFRELRAGGRHAVSTAGDLLFHIRATRMDLCFELAGLIMDRFRGAGTVAD